MDWAMFWVVYCSMVIGVVIGIIAEKVINKKKAPWAGNVLIDLRRDCDDMIQIESPRNISKWKDYKYLTYSVIVFGKPAKNKKIFRRE